MALPTRGTLTDPPTLPRLSTPPPSRSSARSRPLLSSTITARAELAALPRHQGRRAPQPAGPPLHLPRRTCSVLRPLPPRRSSAAAAPSPSRHASPAATPTSSSSSATFLCRRLTSSPSCPAAASEHHRCIYVVSTFVKSPLVTFRSGTLSALMTLEVPCSGTLRLPLPDLLHLCHVVHRLHQAPSPCLSYAHSSKYPHHRQDTHETRMSTKSKNTTATGTFVLLRFGSTSTPR